MRAPFEIVLASASPRRRALLEQAGLDFQVRPTHVDESLDIETEPRAAALTLAERKARAGAAAWGDAPALVVGSDTIVAVPEGEGWRMLGKPVGPVEAEEFLRALSGSTHEVLTGVCVVATPSGACRVEVEVTEVTMRALTAAEVADYVASGEWRDKAGGYAIQETADRFVTSLAGGGFDNVVGLPVERTLRLFRALTREENWPWG